MAEIRYHNYDYHNFIAPGAGRWHTFGPTNLMPSSRMATISMTAVAFPAGHPATLSVPEHAVVRVEHVHVTRFASGTTKYGANVFNAGPGGFFDYRIGVTIIGDFVPPEVVAPPPPGGTPPIGELFPVSAIHDDAGQILSLIVRSPDAPPAQLEMQWGERATEIEVPRLTRELDPAQIFDILSDLAENHQVEARGATGVLKRRQ
jgi:hypothetical protein